MKPLSDPLKDREVNDVKPPPHRPLNKRKMFSIEDNGISNDPFFSNIIVIELPD